MTATSTKRNSYATVSHYLYEQIKANLTAKATTQAEFNSACREAAKLAGV
jgi:hypothetical protein